MHIPVGDRPHPHLLMSLIPPCPSHEALLLSRKSFSAEVPARVEYSMSEKGKSLGGVLKMLFTWVEANK